MEVEIDHQLLVEEIILLVLRYLQKDQLMKMRNMMRMLFFHNWNKGKRRKILLQMVGNSMMRIVMQVVQTLK